MKYQINNLDELHTWTSNLMNALEQKSEATIITLQGEVGVGKTTLTQSIGQLLGITESITSPTFVIQKEYTIDNHSWIKKMIHIDAYRLEKKEDLEYLGLKEIIADPNNLILIEWPEMVQGIDIPKPIHLGLSINDDHSRTIIKTTM